MSSTDLAQLKYRVEHFLDGVTDGTLLVLKGHLLMEEVLNGMVRARCENPQYVVKAQLGYFRLMNIARALYPSFGDHPNGKLTDADIWSAIEALNGLRNQLAHSLEPKDLTRFFAKMMVGPIEKGAPLSDPKVIDGLSISIAILLGFMSGFTRGQQK